LGVDRVEQIAEVFAVTDIDAALDAFEDPNF
jgi:hypothetical protein